MWKRIGCELNAGTKQKQGKQASKQALNIDKASKREEKIKATVALWKPIR